MTIETEYTIGKDAWEVGWAHYGCAEFPSVNTAVLIEQRMTLRKMLDAYGSETALWWRAPEIRHSHNHGATVGIGDFGKMFYVNDAMCTWAVYGILKGEAPPEHGYVPEGTRIPNRDKEQATDG